MLYNQYHMMMIMPMSAHIGQCPTMSIMRAEQSALPAHRSHGSHPSRERPTIGTRSARRRVRCHGGVSSLFRCPNVSAVISAVPPYGCRLFSCAMLCS